MIFDEAMRTDVLSYLELETDLRHAINDRNLMLHYRPIMCLETDRIFGFEALLRWNHEKHGFIPSSDFIPMAEDTGLIIPIGNWVLQEACRQLSVWQVQFPSNPPLTVSINVSSKQLSHPDFISLNHHTAWNWPAQHTRARKWRWCYSAPSHKLSYSPPANLALSDPPR